MLVSGISASSRRPASPLPVIASSRSTRTRPSSRVWRRGELPVDEPGLTELVRRELAAGSLRFTTDREEAARGAEVVWIAYDTPGRRGRSRRRRPRGRPCPSRCRDGRPERCDPHLVAASRRNDPAAGAGRVHRDDVRVLAREPAPRRRDRGVRATRIGSSSGSGPTATASRIEELFGPLAGRIEWMDVESAELVKHGLNAFLACPSRSRTSSRPSRSASVPTPPRSNGA